MILTLIPVSAFSGLEKMTVKNLDLDYIAPSGKGMVERVGIGMSLVTTPYDLEILRTEDSFELTSPYVDFTWKHPLKFIYDLEAFTLRKTTAGLGTKNHFLESETFIFTSRDKNVYKAQEIKAKCLGSATGPFEKRLFEDCRKSMDVTIKRFDVPKSFILTRLVEGLPVPVVNEIDIPADNVNLSVKNGNFSLQVYLKLWFYAGLRTWGQMHYENERQTIVLKVDQIKFGYLPVTNLVMNKLKEIVKSPDVKVEPPFIRINTKRLYEVQ